MRVCKSFQLEPDNSSALVSDAFGISAGWENRVLDVDIPNELPQITLITGESGCGKTTLLKEIGKPTAVEIPNKPLHSWGETDEESLRLLSGVGLNDASLFCLRYECLSDSQQARARIYAALAAGIKTLIVDEFLATLDRATAKALAFSFQRIVRREKLQLIAATAQNDLIDFLRPDLLISGVAFPSRWTTKFLDTKSNSNPFVDELKIAHVVDNVTGRLAATNKITGKKYVGGYKEGSTFVGRDKYRESALAELHYKGKYCGATKEYLFADFDGREVGVLVATKKRTGGLRISRVVVHPSYRGVGIGQAMVKRFLKAHENDSQSIDTIAAMAQFNPFFARAGMTRIEDVQTKVSAKLVTELRGLGFDERQWASKQACDDFCERRENRVVLFRYAKVFAGYYHPGGRPANNVEVGEAMLANQEIAGRLLWVVRPHKMARYVYERKF